MRRFLSAFVVAGSVFTLLISGPSAQAPRQMHTSSVTLQATSVSQLRQWDTFVTDRSRANDLRLVSVERDPALPLRVVERYDQYYRGVRVFGADVVRDSQDGVPLSIFGVLAGDLTIPVEPELTPDAARDTLLQHAGDEARLLTQPELVVLAVDTGDSRLAYAAVVAGAGDVVRVFLDAHSGVELLRFTEIQRQEPAIGTGTGVLGDRKKISVEAEGGQYFAFDRHRPPIIQTFDMRGNLIRTKLLEIGILPYLPSDIASDADNVWSDVSVVDAQVHVSWTYDYYFKRFGRSGLDGRDSPIDIVVNAVTQEGALSLSDDDFDYAINASWCGFCGPGGRGRMYFGNGIPPDFVFVPSGQNYTFLSGALDVAAHELTHAVTDATSALVYMNESGALNEAFSDIMSKSVEFFYHPAGNGVGQADYVIGKDVVRGLRPGALNGIRSMENPGLFGDPDHYSRRYRGTDDNGGVHINSSIPNHAFYLAIEGGRNRTSGMTVQGVGGANREQIEKVFYRAFTLLMPSNATFSVARAATLQAARDLYGAGSAAERAVADAWSAVGVN